MCSIRGLVTLSYIIKAKFRRKWFPISAAIFFLWAMIASRFVSRCDASFLSAISKCDNNQCLHGSCVGNRCVCDLGWQGPTCGECGGRISLTKPSGYITDGFGNYSSDLQCTWLVDSGLQNATIRLQLNYFETECSWDHLYIFDGDSIYAPMIAALSGSLLTDANIENADGVAEIAAQSGSAFLYFYSDAAYNMTGFNVSYSINSCSRNCSRNGVCVGDRCTCDAGFEGDACDRPICPNACSGHGECDKTHHRCRCHFGYVGADCSQSKSDGFWSVVSTTNTPNGRALHQAAIYQDTMYVVGGEHFERKSNEPFLVKYDMRLKKWDSIAPNEMQPHKPEPEPRFGHSVVMYNHRLFVYGGILRNGTITSELWEFDLLNERWRTLDDGRSRFGEICCPISSAGHTATMFNHVMIVIFGYNPTLGFLNQVQHYNLNLQEWKLIKTTGASVKGGFGHSSTYDHLTRLIYVFGGYHSINFADNLLVDLLYSYDPKKESWRLLSPSKAPRYLHSASIIHGMLLIFGGNGHNVTDDNSGDTCFSPQFLVYDITCDTWRTMKLPSLVSIERGNLFGRYGHTSVVYDDALYIFGGFSGIMHNSLMKYVPGNCSHFGTLDECSELRLDAKCVWNKEKQICVPFGQHKSTSAFHHCPPSPDNNNHLTELCQRQSLCSNCLTSSYHCVWCGDKCSHNKCAPVKSSSLKEGALLPKAIKDAIFCEARDRHIANCNKMHNCHSCHNEHSCTWQRERTCLSLMSKSIMFENWSPSSSIDGRAKSFSSPSLSKIDAKLSSDDIKYETNCEAPCYTRTSCENCTQASCMWCNSQRQCIESNAYSAIYPIGQCMEWTTHPYKCAVLTCTDIQSCDKCLKKPQCGWCDNGSGTGVGVCLEGSSRGPINSTNKVLERKRCPAPNWHFTMCPLCQCNGHSKCTSISPSVCNRPCSHFTEGPNCEHCIDRFYGNPINGGTCSPCSCNGHSDSCHRETGKCSCTTKGITGHHCDKCDELNKYVGNPQDLSGSCFYNLSTSYSYTFNMSKPDDRYYTRINLMNMPHLSDIDVEFTVMCQKENTTATPGLVNISVGSVSNHTLNITRQLYHSLECGNIKLRFAHSDYPFGIGNTTFFVNVYNFSTPLMVQISFSQHRNLDILQFFLTFSSCFLALLIVAAILWKIKQKYELYRRRQQLFVEMEQMASRPFAGVVLHMDKNVHVNGATVNAANPTPIALEPCNNGKAAVLTLIVRLPTGGHQIPPSGQTGIALASALVSLGNVSLEQSYKEDKSGEKGMCNNKMAANSTAKLNNMSSTFSTGV